MHDERTGPRSRPPGTADSRLVEPSDLDGEPLPQLERWLDAARRAGEPMPEAMTLATASSDGGLVFFADYDSDKGHDLEANPRAAAVLHWHLPVHRQVRVTGPVATVSAEESDRYWHTRPPGARRSAVASLQSRVVPSRLALEERVAELARLHPDDSELPRPARWGGYRITPVAVELWEEGPDRLHDRLRYRPAGEGWTIDRLSP